ncbi:MAG: shikimate kinase [Ruminococcaceae bacterium]|nr:shikimate kinase [Oscillospiraceae bacterium]
MPVYGLLGRKLGHSWSSVIHGELGLRDYKHIELEPEELRTFFATEDIGAVNVTIPYKKDVMAFCDVIDPGAAAIGSVNTIVKKADGRLFGYNTDITGFCYMADRAGISMEGKKVLVLGSGGSSLTACHAAALCNAKSVTVISRTGENNYSNLHLHADADIIVNTTPVGMYPKTGEAPLELGLFPKLSGVIDIVYNPRRTALLLRAEELGIPCTDGLPMLVSQAVKAEEHFFGRDIAPGETERIIAALRAAMTNVVLIGMPGCGKTTVGAELAALSGREAIDIDACITERIGCSIPQFFAREGEAAFRKIEHEEIEKAGKLSGKIIVTGGGAVTVKENYAPLHQNGRIYQLFRPLELLPTAGRPISQGNPIEELYARRAPLYEAFADKTVYNTAAPAETAEEIWRDFCEHSGD